MTFTPLALSEEEKAALRDYAAAHGRTWKASLREDWLSARGADAGILRQLRNSPRFGPRGLIAVRLDDLQPTDAPAPTAGEDITTITEYGLTQPLSRAVRMF